MTLPDDTLAAHADAADRSTDWPAASWAAVRDAGVLCWAVPPEYGGFGRGPVELLAGYERVAAACPTTAFILSQREAAVRQLLRGPAHLRDCHLPAVAGGAAFATVGLSQLTTSRQHGRPALRATPTAAGYQLDGEVPWVTAADRADVLILGATLPNGAQLLVALPADRAGLAVGPPLPLAALAGSRTAAVHCDGVTVEADEVVAGPAPQVLGPVGGGGLETSVLALGVAVAAVGLLAAEASRRPDLAPTVVRFQDTAEALRGRLHALAVAPDPDGVLAARVNCTRLALRASQAALLVSKGAGFVHAHPAGRLARQAQFFLVWSCPRPVAAGVLDDLLPA